MCGAKYDDECESGVMHARVREAWLRLRALGGGKVYTLKRLVKGLDKYAGTSVTVMGEALGEYVYWAAFTTVNPVSVAVRAPI